MRLADLWAKHGGDTLNPDSDATQDLFIFGVTDDSRDVRFGYLFCALPGTREDGLAFCAQAAANGAQAIAVAEGTRDEALGLSEYEREKIVVLRVRDIRAFYARLAADFHPGCPTIVAAVTGTNGKTSTVCFLRDLWGADGRSAISLGTLGLQSRENSHSRLEAGLTTYDAKTLHIMLGELERTHRITHLAMEASSHALDQQRLAGLKFDAAGFTNLTQDHLDYHTSMEAYLQAKMRLFNERLKADGVAVINTRDTSGVQIAAALRSGSTRIISYGEAGGDADLMVRERIPHVQGQTLKLSAFGASYDVEAPVAGAFQAENILCALGLAVGTGVPVDRAIAGIGGLASVPGRLELAAVVANGAAVYVDYAHTPDALDNVLRSVRPHVGANGKLHVLFGCGGDRAIAAIGRLASVPGRLELAAVLANRAAVYVDYAHTPDALDNVLRSVRPHVGANGKLHVLFGCGGDRDPGKRPIMGRIAGQRSDCVWVTDDNPRTEDPDAIRRQVLSGATGATHATDAGPRREALQIALSALRSGDVLVVAGKGHEDYQVVIERDAAGLPRLDSRGRPVTKKIPFSDAKVIREITAST